MNTQSMLQNADAGSNNKQHTTRLTEDARAYDDKFWSATVWAMAELVLDSKGDWGE